MWRKVDEVVIGHHRNLMDEDVCLYYMEKPKVYPQSDDAADLISNFKKPVERKGLPEWRYREDAVKTFASNLVDFVIDNDLQMFRGGVLVPVPPSRPKADASYNDRVKKACELATSSVENFVCCDCFDTKEYQGEAHNGASRDYKVIMQNIEFDVSLRDVLAGANNIFIVDDVLTTGAHFRAVKKLLLDAFESFGYSQDDLPRIYGIFWARACY